MVGKMERPTSLHIRNFKCFDDFTLETIGDVNLIAGKNNVGKTSLLEAVAIWASGGHPKELFRILDQREHPTSDAELRRSFLGLFPELPCFIGSDRATFVKIDSPAVPLDISLKPLWNEFRRDPSSKLNATFSLQYLLRGFAYDLSMDAKGSFYSGELDDNPQVRETIKKCLWGFDSNSEPRMLRKLWDGIAARPAEQLVVDALRLIEPRLARVTMPSDWSSSTPLIRLENETELAPISRFGDGMKKLFEIALVLAHSQGGILLLDEIENGLHHSVFPQFWKFVFEAARRLNVTVFATTHSYDAVAAFTQVAMVDTESLGVLTRLDQRKGGIVPVQFTEEQAVFAFEEGLEVR
jgi:hypothetical protein